METKTLKIFITAVICSITGVLLQSSVSPIVTAEELQTVAKDELENHFAIDSTFRTYVLELVILDDGDIVSCEIIRPKSLRCDSHYLRFCLSIEKLLISEKLYSEYIKKGDKYLILSVPVRFDANE